MILRWFYFKWINKKGYKKNIFSHWRLEPVYIVGSRMNLLELYMLHHKYGKAIMCSNISGKYDTIRTVDYTIAA